MKCSFNVNKNIPQWDRLLKVTDFGYSARVLLHSNCVYFGITAILGLFTVPQLSYCLSNSLTNVFRTDTNILKCLDLDFFFSQIESNQKLTSHVFSKFCVCFSKSGSEEWYDLDNI